MECEPSCVYSTSQSVSQSDTEGLAASLSQSSHSRPADIRHQRTARPRSGVTSPLVHWRKPESWLIVETPRENPVSVLEDSGGPTPLTSHLLHQDSPSLSQCLSVSTSVNSQPASQVCGVRSLSVAQLTVTHPVRVDGLSCSDKRAPHPGHSTRGQWDNTTVRTLQSVIQPSTATK